jgi:hypothetical protein
VLGDAGGDERMGHLEDERRAAANQQDALAIHTPRE